MGKGLTAAYRFGIISRFPQPPCPALCLPDRMPDHCLSLLRRDFSGIAQIDLMVSPFPGDVQGIALLLHVGVHHGNGGGFSIIGADMHTLDAQPLVVGQKRSL